MRVHFHSDCAFFSGSENMLVNFFAEPQLRAAHEISFSYRQSERYEEGLRQRVTRDFPVYPLNVIDPDDALGKAQGAGRILAILWRLIAYYPLLLSQFLMFRRLLRRLRPDVLHINNGGYPGALSCRAIALAGKAAGIKHILMVVNNLAVSYNRPARWLDYPVDRLVARAVDRFVTGSSAAAARMVSVLRLSVQKSVAIHNGIRVRPVVNSREVTRARLGLAGFDGTVFGIVALLEPRKGHAVLIDAVARLTARPGASKIKLLIEGHGPLAGELSERIEANGLGEVVTLIGDEARVFDFMGALDVLVLSSVRDEDFPNVILEGMSLGLPVMASRLAGTPEQVEDGVTGILVEPGNVEALADAMQALAGAAQRRRMGEAAKTRFETKFASEVAVRRYLDLYGELAETRVPG